MQTRMLTAVPYKTGQRVLTFEYELALCPSQDGTFELSLWAPMPSFQVNPGGQITTTIQLPSSNSQAFKANIIDAKGYQADPNGETTTEIPAALNQEFLLRRILVWTWQNNPLFKVKYQYV